MSKYYVSNIMINNQKLEQLWYGLEETPSSSLTPTKNCVYSKFSCKNELVYTEEPSRDLSGKLHNEEISTFYVPSVSFELSYVNADVYSNIIKTLNTRSFTVSYFDYELLKYVTRTMYMSEKSIDSLHIVGSEIYNNSYRSEFRGVCGVKVTFVSINSYKDYEDLAK